MATTNDPGTSTARQDASAHLVDLLRRNDATAAREFDRQYREALMRFCWGYLGDANRADDAVQEICCKILDTKNIPDHLRPWTYKIARHHCLNLLRAKASRKDNTALPSASRVPDQLTGHLTRLVRKERQEQMADLVRTLSVDQSEVLRLRYVENLSRGEIATVLDLPENVVKSRIYEGLKTLRTRAAELGDT